MMSIHSSHGHRCFRKPNAVEVASLAVEKLINDSVVVSSSRFESLPRFNSDEIGCGSLLGTGEFSDVYEIVHFKKAQHVMIHDNDNISQTVEDKYEDRDFMTKQCKRKETGEARYAIKFLKRGVVNGYNYCHGAIDLAIEGYILSSISHPNILKLRGVCGLGLNGLEPRRHGGYFLIMDRLYDTLEKRIQQWANIAKSKRYSPLEFIRMTPKKKALLFAERLKVAHDLSSAMAFLHKKNIIHRDLKPENIGFDVKGNVKIFDFGLAATVSSQEMNADGTYNLLPDMGTRKYMAPEVALAKPYNLFSDVYSFSIILYEMCSLERLWDDYSLLKHEELIITGKERPQIHKDWSSSIKNLIKNSWADAWNMRPSFADIHCILQREIITLQCGKNTDLEVKTRSVPYQRELDQSKTFTDINLHEARRSNVPCQRELDQSNQFTDINLHDVRSSSVTRQRELDQSNQFTDINLRDVRRSSVKCQREFDQSNTFTDINLHAPHESRASFSF